MSLSSEKRMEILQLLSTGKITADEAAELLSAPPKVEVETPTPPPTSKAPEPFEKPAPSNGNEPKWLHIQVNDLATGKSKVKVNVPLRMVKFGLNIGKRFSPEMEGMEWDDLSRVMTEDAGVLVDVRDEEDGEHVQIYVD